MFGWLKQLGELFRVPTLEERLAQYRAKLHFCILPDYEGSYTMVEINLGKFLADQNEYERPDINKPDNRQSAGKFRSIERDMRNNNGMMPIPVVTGIVSDDKAAINNGRHRFSTLHAMGIKVVPAMYCGTSVSEEFLERYGVDRTYYQPLPEGAKYRKVMGDTLLLGDPVRAFEPISRPLIMQEPGSYKKIDPEPLKPGQGHTGEIKKETSPGEDRNHQRL